MQLLLPTRKRRGYAIVATDGNVVRTRMQWRGHVYLLVTAAFERKRAWRGPQDGAICLVSGWRPTGQSFRDGRPGSGQNMHTATMLPTGPGHFSKLNTFFLIMEKGCPNLIRSDNNSGLV
jgi:hypothetical protein